jgi:hypothetical protein
MNGLQYLLKAPSKKVVDQIFVEIFKNRSGVIRQEILQSLVAALSITLEESEEVIYQYIYATNLNQLVNSVRFLIKTAIYENTSNLSHLFPEDFHKDLRNLLLQIVDAHLPQWRDEVANNQCSLPRLKEFDWRIDVKRASDNITNMSVPTVLVQLKVIFGIHQRVENEQIL